MHGMTPGPVLYQKNPDFIWAVIASMFIGNVMLLIMNLPMAGLWAKVALIPYKLLFPLILIISMVGVYSIDGSLWDVGMMIFFGMVGYIMKKLEIPSAALILAFILGREIEFTLVQSLSTSGGSLAILINRPISGFLISLCAFIFVASVISAIKKKRSHLADDAEM